MNSVRSVIDANQSEMMTESVPDILSAIQDKLLQQESTNLFSLAAKNADAVRRHPEMLSGYRQAYAVDADRILHSKAYTRYIDKTQVFSLVSNDHITHRVLHVQLVSKIARTIGRFLALNEDLIEAIALGHDIGHPPFGHEGENILAQLCRQHDLPPFQHNIQSIRFLEKIERQSNGWNLSLQTLDGILCHDGEIHNNLLVPEFTRTFKEFDAKLDEKSHHPSVELTPATLEGCVVRLADTIAYIGRDIEDAITLGIIHRNDIPAACQKALGKTNGTIVHSLVTDVIEQSYQQQQIGFSPSISAALLELKSFNYERIYLNPLIKKESAKIRTCYQTLFNHYTSELDNNVADSPALIFAKGVSEAYCAENPVGIIAADFLAGMTDDYFLNQANAYGCEIPVKQ